MTDNDSLELIGIVISEIVKKMYQDLKDTDAFGRFSFDNLDKEVLTAGINKVCELGEYLSSDPVDGIDIKIPRILLDENSTKNKAVFFEGNAAAVRNSTTTKRLLVFANGSAESIEDTLRQVKSITEEDILKKTDEWIAGLKRKYPQLDMKVASEDLGPMLSGLHASLKKNIKLLSKFVDTVANSIINGNNIFDSVNDNLYILGYPRFQTALPSFDDKTTSKDKSDEWTVSFKKIHKECSEYFVLGKCPETVDITKLKTNLNKIKDDLAEEGKSKQLEVYKSIAFGDGKHAWLELIEFDWTLDSLDEFIKGKGKEPKKALAKETLEYFELHENDILSQTISGYSDTVREYLEEFGNKKIILGELDQEKAQAFYFDVSHCLKNNPKLDRKWDKLIFRDHLTGENFIDLLLDAVRILSKRKAISTLNDPVVFVNCITKSDTFISSTNIDLKGYFSLAYKCLESLASDFIVFRFQKISLKRTQNKNPLFHLDCVPKASGKGDEENKDRSYSTSKEALKLEFHVCIVEREVVDNVSKREKFVPITWSIPNGNISLSLYRDFKELYKSNGKKVVNNTLKVIYGRSFKQTNNKGLISEISLDDISSFGLTTRSFVSRNLSNLTDLGERFEEALKTQDSDVDVTGIRHLWDEFKEIYAETITSVMGEGYSCPKILKMHESYQRLLTAISANAEKSQLFRVKAIPSLLLIGIFSFVDSNSSYALVTPWNPIRLFELHRSVVKKIGLIKTALTCCEDFKAVYKGFLEQLEIVSQNLLPAFVIVPEHESASRNQSRDNIDKNILAPVEFSHGYTLYTCTAGLKSKDSVSNPAIVSELSDTVLNNYLKLMPSATNCLNILLPDIKSKTFAINVMNALYKNRPSDMRLSITVGGLDCEGYTEETEDNLYKGLITQSNRETSVEEASFAASSVKSEIQLSVVNSRENIIRDSQYAKNSQEQFDVAYLDRFFTYSAQNTWITLPKRIDESSIYNLTTSLQSCSRRLVRLEDEFTSRTLLCGTSVPESFHTYINLVSWILRGNSADHGDHFDYPCLEVNCNTSEIAKTISQVHELARWVVTSNDLIDKRQLINNNINIVRYKRNAKTGLTSIVSSEMPTEMLSQRIIDKLNSLNCDKNLSLNVSKKILKNSYRISGYVALRAARTLTATNEIIGLALSEWLAKCQLFEQAKKSGETVIGASSFLIDDFAYLFKNKSKLADLICFVLTAKDEHLNLHIYITESKFCSNSVADTEKQYSKLQLSATLEVLQEALVDDAKSHPDKPIWLARLADFILSMSKDDLSDADALAHCIGVPMSRPSSNDIISFSDALKNGNVDITIGGASHVFVCDFESLSRCTSLDEADSNLAKQFVFYQKATNHILALFDSNTSPINYLQRIFQDEQIVDKFEAIDLVKNWDFADTLSYEWIASKKTISTDEEQAQVNPVTIKVTIKNGQRVTVLPLGDSSTVETSSHGEIPISRSEVSTTETSDKEIDDQNRIGTTNPDNDVVVKKSAEESVAETTFSKDFLSPRIKFGTDITTNNSIYWEPGNTDKVMHTNTGIIGTMGTGKTQFTKSLITQLYRSMNRDGKNSNFGILIFDYKGDYGNDHPEFVKATNATVLDPYHLPFNPLQLNVTDRTRHLLPVYVANTFKETISCASISSFGQIQKDNLRDAILSAYESKGIIKDDRSTWLNTPPTFVDVYNQYLEKTDPTKKDSLGAILNEIQLFEIFESNPEKIQSLYDLIKGVVVINLKDADPSYRNLIVGLTLDLFYQQMRIHGHSKIDGKMRELTKFILVDEADNILRQEFQSIRNIMKEGREFGVGVILSTQFLKHFRQKSDDYSKYILTWVVHKVSDLEPKDVDFVFGTEPKSETEQLLFQRIKNLQTHNSFLKLGNSSTILCMKDYPFYKLLQEDD